MEGNLQEIVTPVLVLMVFFFMLREFLAYLTRKRLIEKGLVGEEAKNLFKSTLDQYVPSSLKWGLVLLLVGAALVVIRLIPGYVPDEVILGTVLISAGVGLLAYYFIAMGKMHANKEKPQ